MKKVLLLTSVCLISSAALAEDFEKKYSMQLNLGAGYALDSTDHYGKLGNSGVIGIEAGARVNNNIRVSVGFDYLPSFSATSDPENINQSFSGTNVPTGSTTDGNGHTVTNNTGSTVSSYTTTITGKPGTRDVESYVGMVNLYYDMDKSDNFTPYLMGGIGMSRNKTKSNETLESVSMPDNMTITTANGTVYHNGYAATRSLDGDTKDNFAWQLGVGTRYDVNNSLAFDFRYQFKSLGEFRTAKDPAGNYYKGKLQVNEVSVGLAYKF